VLQREVVGEAVEPAREARLAAKAREPLVRAKEHLLRHFLRVPVRERTEQSRHQPEDAPLVPLDQHAEELRVAGAQVLRDGGRVLHKCVSAARSAA
jgi:hypothetical protein